MKKLLYFAAALLVLAGCKKDNALTNAPEGTPFKKGQQVTLTVGTGDNANQAAPRKVAGTDNVDWKSDYRDRGHTIRPVYKHLQSTKNCIIID